MKHTILSILFGILLGILCSICTWNIVAKNSCPQSSVDLYNHKLKSINKTVVMIGDSYGVNYVTRSEAHPYTTSDTGRWVGWVDIFTLLFPNLKTYQSAVGGSGFIGGVKETFEVQLDSLIEKIDHSDEITDVIVIGGYNDMSICSTEEDLDKAISSFTKTAKTAFPKATISFMYVSVDYANSVNKNSLDKYGTTFYQLCLKHGINYVANAHNILDSKNLIFWDESDLNSGFHPNTQGSIKIAEKIAEYLIYGYIN